MFMTNMSYALDQVEMNGDSEFLNVPDDNWKLVNNDLVKIHT